MSPLYHIAMATHMNGFSAMKNLGGKNYLAISALTTTHRGLTHLGIKLTPSHRDSVKLKPDSECERTLKSHANRGDCQERQRV